MMLIVLWLIDLWNMASSDLFSYGWLGDSSLFPIAQIELSIPEKEEVYLPDWLRYLSLTTPIFVFACGVVSIYHTWLHHNHI